MKQELMNTIIFLLHFGRSCYFNMQSLKVRVQLKQLTRIAYCVMIYLMIKQLSTDK